MANEKRLDLIDRKDLIKAVEKKHFAIADNTHPYEAIRIQGKYFREVVDNAPTVEAVEVVHGRWELYPSSMHRRCSVCKMEYDRPKFNVRANYCPNCGAKMDGDGNGR